ncbi:hypothetical protein FAI40_03520 [Acetobacteraceae bacterium]|nr:hypothetical protein FAI40_03520 [Acetobacteraceae bacterium]
MPSSEEETQTVPEKAKPSSSKNSSSWIIKTLEWAYAKSLKGLWVIKSVEELGAYYLKHHQNDPVKAVEALILAQESKAGVNGFCMNFGGLMFLPLTLPFGLLMGLYIQLRMITVIAVIGGYNVHDPRVKTLCYICLAGKNAKKIFTSAGIKAGGKVSAAMLSGMSHEVILLLQKGLGLQAMARFSPAGVVGGAGAVGFGRFLPIAGGFISGAWASYMASQMGKVARGMFIDGGRKKGKNSTGEDTEAEETDDDLEDGTDLNHLQADQKENS